METAVDWIPMKTSGAGRSRFDRVLGITVLTGFSLVLVVGVVFAIAYGSRNITSRATNLHTADESLRSATVVRAQVTLATYMAAVDQQLGTVTLEARNLAQQEAGLALVDLEEGMGGLEAGGIAGPESLVAATEFITTSSQTLAALEVGDVAGAQLLVDARFDRAFHELVGHLVGIRDQMAAEVEASDRLLGRIGDVARFLVAFFIPAAVILIYRELVRRRQAESDLENRLESERRLARYREEFIANASHELRTPLTGIVGMAMIAEEDQAVQSSPMLSELVHTIISEANDLSRMVEDLLTTARLDAGALSYSFEDVEIGAEVDNAATSLIRSGLNVTVDCEPAFVRTDRTRIRQVVRNLLSNAYKYGGPEVRVSGRVAEATYLHSVSDNGDGLPSEVETRLFQRFVHAEQRAGTIDSVGLGLSIVDALVGGMGGAVTYQRKAGETCFDVRIPLSAAASHPGDPATEPTDWRPAATPRSERGAA